MSLKIELPYHATVTTGSNQRGIEIEIENSHDILEPLILTYIFENSGHKHLVKTVTDDMLFELLDERQEDLHNYLEQNGYIFNKA